MARKITTYKCVTPKCGEADHDRGNNDPAPADLNCPKCHGRGTMQIVSIDAAE